MNLLSEDQIQEYREAFCIFDKKSCGFVPATDLRELLKTIGLNPTDGPTETMITEIDLDQNGLIDFGKFLNLVQRFETDEKNEKEGRKHIICLIRPLFPVQSETVNTFQIMLEQDPYK